MFSVLRIFANHEINAWREEQTLRAGLVLNQLAADLILSFENKIQTATWKDGLVAQQRFIAAEIAPDVRTVAGPVVEKLVAHANEEMVRLARTSALWHDRPERPLENSGAAGGWQDIALAAGPLAGGVAVAASMPAIAVTTSTAFFGLVTTTVVSWPVVLGAGSLAGLALMTGAFNASRVWPKAEGRLRQKVRAHVLAVLLKGSTANPSLLEQLTEIYAATAKLAKKL